MFKTLGLLMTLSLSGWTSSAYAGYSGMPPSSVPHYIPFVSTFEKADLPPRLIASFEVDCSERFVGVYRQDHYDPVSRSVIITIAGQVQHLNTNCAGSFGKVEVDAGPTYSGQRFQIRQMRPVL
jgi:hypothetical protein